MSTAPSLEVLEARIAPASVSVTFADVDGDVVKVTTSAGPLDLADLTFVGGGTSGQLATLDLTDPGFSKAKISFSVSKKPGGDGLVHLGYIKATGNDLTSVTLKGDLGRIDAGNGNAGDGPGLAKLSVGSFGFYGLATQGGTGNLSSTINGELTSLTVARDFVDATLKTAANGAIKSIKVGRSIIGGATAGSGLIESSDAIGSVTVGQNIVGGLGNDSGGVVSDEGIATVKIGGNIIGGAGTRSGGIGADDEIGSVVVGRDIVGGSGSQSGGIASFRDILSVKVGGSIQGGAGDTSGGIGSFFGLLKSITIGKDLRGGTGPNSGGIATGDEVGTVKIGGSVVGGAGEISGTVYGAKGIGSVTVGGNIQGGMGDSSGGIAAENGLIAKVVIKGNIIGATIGGSDSLTNSGGILAMEIGSVTIGGSIIAGVDGSTGDLVRSGSIAASKSIASITIKGGIVGNATHSVVISAEGLATVPDGGDDFAIGQISVGRDVHYAVILAGFDFASVAKNADASIGKITVGGNWRASSIVAGAQDAGDPGFGVGDALQTVSDDPALTARIASVQIKGSVGGTAKAGDNFGFVAQQIGLLSIAGRTVALTANAPDNLLLPYTDDVHVLEV